MSDVPFSTIAIGQQFSLRSDGINPAVKIEPTGRTGITTPCRYCGEPAATWVNARFVEGVVSMHVCPGETVYLEG